MFKKEITKSYLDGALLLTINVLLIVATYLTWIKY